MDKDKEEEVGARPQADQALVASDGAAARLHPTGFDPSRESISDVRRRAWATRRAKYGPRGHDSSYSRGSGFADALKKAQEAMRPFFDERRRIREENAPGAMQALTDMGVVIDTIGGNCPVQAEGVVDGKSFYFRARGEHWSLEVGPEQTWHGHGAWLYEEEYGSWPDAGWMHEHEALAFIAKGVERYRDSDRSGEAGETRSGSTVGESAGPQGHRPSLSTERTPHV